MIQAENISKTFAEYEKNISILKNENHDLNTAYNEKLGEIGKI